MKRILHSLALAAIILQSCIVEEENARFNVRLTDAPADYQEVLIEIVDIQFSEGDQDLENEWISLNRVKTGKYNLLDFTNGLDTLLVSDVLPPGHISQIRLILGDENFIKMDGEYHALKTPSAQQSGLKLKTNIDLIEGVNYDLWIDFNAAKSIVDNKNFFILKPVIRTFTEATSGAITGVMTPNETRFEINAVSENLNDTLSTYSDTISGKFMFKGVADGKYHLKIKDEINKQEIYIDNVVVEIGESTNLGTISLN